MTCSPEPSPLSAAIAEASGRARELIEVLKREAEALAGAGGVAPAGLIEVKAGLIAAYAHALERLRETPCVPELTLDELRALDELKALDAELMMATLDSLIEIYPEKIELRYRRAGILASQGRDDEAHRDYLAVLRIR